MTDDDWVRRTLEDAVGDVEPDTGSLEAIRARTQTAPRRRAWAWAAGGAVAGIAATLVAVATLDTGDVTTGEPDVAGSPSVSPTPSDDPTQAPPDTTTNVPVYYLGQVSFHQGEGGALQTAVRLYREWHEVPGVPQNATPEEVATAALHQMLTSEPVDPDYTNVWAEGVDVASVTRAGGEITVDLTGPVQESAVGAESAELAVQQLVYTVQGALAHAGAPSADEPVRILLEGAPAGDLWGHVDLSRPVARAARTGIQAPIWVTAPTHGETVTSPVTVEGLAQVFEANVSWRLLDDGRVVHEGFATASEGAPAFGTFSFEVEVPPGTYTVEVYESSALDGSELFLDSKQVTVE